MEQPTTRDFLIHLTQGNYQAAIDLADELQLEKELVYKAQWTKCKESGKIQHKQVGILKLVQDDAWVSGECLSTLVEDGALQKDILILGQQRANTVTAPLLATKTPDTKDKVWLRTRFYFIQYLDRLETFIKIWPSIANQDTPFSKAYDQFRDCNLVAQAIEYARLEHHHALDALFMHHGNETLPYRLFILSQIPETANPDRFVLPHVTQQHEDKWLEEPWRKPQDPVESDEIQKMIHLDVPNYDEYVKRLEEKIQATEYPTSSKVIADWYMNRAKAVDSIGLSNNALEMSRYAQVMGVTGIELQVAEYEWLCKYVYVSRPVQSIEDVVTLEKFREMSNEVILQGLLSNTTDIVSDMMGLALPWVEVCRKQRMDKQLNKDEKPEMLLYRWLLDQMEKRLDLCCAVFEASKPTTPIEDRIIKDDLDLSRLILSITYLSQGPLEYLVRMFECLPIFSDLDDGEESTDPTDFRVFLNSSGKEDTPIALFKALEPVGPYGLTQMIDTLQNHLGSAEVLHRYHVDIPPRWYLEEQSIESQRQLCTRMSSQAAGGVESGGAQFNQDDDWRELLDDMVRLHDNGQGIFGKLEQPEILEIFFSSLLRCGRFELAKKLIGGSTKLLDINKAEQIVIDSEREFFDNATTGNMQSGSMKQAWECLQVLPASEEIKKEMDLIKATHTLIYECKVQDRPGITLMPIQIRQSKNRLDLISKLIHARRDIYKRHDKVLELVEELGYGNDLLSKVKTMSMLSSAALVNEDYLESYRLCQITVEMAQNKVSGKSKSYNDEIDQAAWKICFNLGKLDSFEDIPRRLDSLSMAMSICPIEHIRDVLAVWRKLDKSANQIDLLMQLDAANGQNRDKLNNSKVWDGILQPWNFGELLSGGEHAERGGGKRKRDIVRNMFDGLLSFNHK